MDLPLAALVKLILSNVGLAKLEFTISLNDSLDKPTKLTSSLNYPPLYSM